MTRIPIRNMQEETRQPFCPVDVALPAGMFLFGISSILIPIRNMQEETRQPFCPVVAALPAGMFLFGISIDHILFERGR